ncbi:hypothetical protein RRSWK_02265 [Rhodopirellula sp. SWK7]|nr:hypothetical protein RRSWK_02265 [Rhodopirellula sp. SWK7]
MKKALTDRYIRAQTAFRLRRIAVKTGLTALKQPAPKQVWQDLTVGLTLLP